MSRRRSMWRAAGGTVAAALLLSWPTAGRSAESVPAAAPAVLDEAIRATEEGNAAAAAAQATIEQIANDTDAMAAEYRKALQETASLQIYNRQLESLLASQDKEMAALNRQIEEVDVVQRQLTPHMLRMIGTLDQFVRLDLPFLPEERGGRVQGLRELMDRADVALSEKYRRLMEAYQVENEYGRTIEAYRGELERDGQSRTVDFLRIGRVALLYQTLDGAETGFWNRSANGWEVLPGDYRGSVKQGLQIARKQVAPDLIRIPVSAPEKVQ